MPPRSARRSRTQRWRWSRGARSDAPRFFPRSAAAIAWFRPLRSQAGKARETHRFPRQQIVSTGVRQAFSASRWRSVSTIRQALIFLSPPRSFSSIDTGWLAGSTAVQISLAAMSGSCTSFSASDASAAVSGGPLNYCHSIGSTKAPDAGGAVTHRAVHVEKYLRHDPLVIGVGLSSRSR